MPQPTLPPTPAPSTDIKGREHGGFQSDHGFDLPPSAMSHRGSDPVHEKVPTDSNAPISPTSPRRSFAAQSSPQKKRTASQAALNTPEEHSLPPPPTRSRKIIQVKPKNQENGAETTSTASSNASHAKAQSGAGGGAPPAGKKGKQAAGTSAGRKIARKTAHSLIERRRRSKMNEEFGVLKDMIPACRGQEMHKLAILQASIDYLRYLENCLADVQGGTRPASSVASSSLPTQQPSRINTPSDSNAGPLVDSDVDDDEEMQEEAPGSTEPSSQHYRNDFYGSTFVSPALSATITSPPFAAQQSSYSARRPSGLNSGLSSPASARFPQDARYAPYQSRTYVPSPAGHTQNPQSNQPSPMLLPQSSHSSAPSELDHEASAALLMLNASDRRTSISGPSPVVSAVRPKDERSRYGIKGISVKDLLSN